MLYLDTSLIVAAVTNEPKSARVLAWLSEQNATQLAISEWVITEMSSAMAIKLRTAHLDLDQRAAALAMFRTLLADSLTVLRITSSHFRTAARFADHRTLGLRAGDALHLATAAEHGATVCTFDQRLAQAGPVLGVPTQLLS